MKRTILTLFTLAAIFGQDKPAPDNSQADYLKAVISLQGFQKRQADLPEAIAREKISIESGISDAQQIIQKIVSAWAADCEKKDQVLDQAALREHMERACIDKPLVAESESKTK